MKDCENHEYIIKLFKPLINELSLTLFDAEKYDSIPGPSLVRFYDKNNKIIKGNAMDYSYLTTFFGIDYPLTDCEGNEYKDYNYLNGL